MKALPVIAVAAALLIVAAALCIPGSTEERRLPLEFHVPDVSDMDVKDGAVPSGSVNALGWDCFDAADGGNILLSPYGIYFALGMLANGSESGSEAEKEMLGILHSDGIDSLNAYLDSLLAANGEEFVSCGMVMVDRSAVAGTSVSEDFAKAVVRYCGGAVSEADFSGDLDAVKALIKEWVSEKTCGLIPDYESIATEDTVCDLLNVVHFKGSWNVPFDSDLTYDEYFHGDGGSVSLVPMMHGTLKGVRYHEDSRFRGIQLEYDSELREGLCMRIILPKDPSSTEVLKEWKSESWENREAFMGKLGSPALVDADISLPKLDLSESLDLKKILSELGLSESATFSGMIDGVPLSVEGGKHQARMIVDEEGTEAAAVTEITMEKLSVIPGSDLSIVEFRCDIPFLMAIVDEETGADLFVGYVGDASL
ncbi:MAG: hypothetical protein IKP20_06455 [Candidatus Methanomethylophilaceae archaeon]|nr:hypothetical protein [Candidatus Methanomethylophilaceae archaeon]